MKKILSVLLILTTICVSGLTTLTANAQSVCPNGYTQCQGNGNSKNGKCDGTGKKTSNKTKKSAKKRNNSQKKNCSSKNRCLNSANKTQKRNCK